jgi:hypothetical protein
MGRWSSGVMDFGILVFANVRVSRTAPRRRFEDHKDDDEYEDESFDYATGAALRTGSGASDLFAPDVPSETGML